MEVQDLEVQVVLLDTIVKEDVLLLKIDTCGWMKCWVDEKCGWMYFVSADIGIPSVLRVPAVLALITKRGGRFANKIFARPHRIVASIACNWDYIALFDRLLYAACTCVAVVALSLLSVMGSFSGPLSHSLRWKLLPRVTATRTGGFFSRVPENWRRSNRRPYSGSAHDATSSGSSDSSSAALVGNVGATQGSASQGRWRPELLNYLVHACNFASWLIFFWFFALGTSMVLEFLFGCAYPDLERALSISLIFGEGIVCCSKVPLSSQV